MSGFERNNFTRKRATIKYSQQKVEFSTRKHKIYTPTVNFTSYTYELLLKYFVSAIFVFVYGKTTFYIIERNPQIPRENNVPFTTINRIIFNSPNI
jgi:hypothetical protein